MAVSGNPLAGLIQALSSRGKKEETEKQKKEVLTRRHEAVLRRLRDIKNWQKTADEKFKIIATTVQRIDSIQQEEIQESKEKTDLPDIKKMLEQINARLAPKVFNLKEEGDFRYDPLAPAGKQVTKLSRQGKSVVGATNKDIEVVLKKAAYIFNQELDARQEKKIKKVDAAPKKKKPAVTAKMAKISNAPSSAPAKKDFTEVYKRLEYEQAEDDPTFILAKTVEKNFKKVFKELKTIRALITNSSGGLGLGIPGLGGGGGRGGRGGPAGGRGGPRGGASRVGAGIRGAAVPLLVGGGLGAYNALREADPNRTTGDIAEQMAVNTAAGAYFGVQSAKSVKDAIAKTKAASRLARMRSANPSALKGSATQASKWSKFLKWMAKKSPKLAAKIGTRLATSAGLMTIPAVGWVGAAINLGMTAWTMYGVYQLWKEYQSLSEEEKIAQETGTATGSADMQQPKPAAATTTPTATAPSPGGQQAQKSTLARQVLSSSYAGGEAATGEELKGVSESGSAKEAMSFFQHKGWTREQSAGIVANLMAESGTNMKTDSYNAGEQAYGIAQWRPPRQEDYKNKFSGGKPITEAGFQQQLEFVNWELNNTEKKAGNALRQATDAPTAAAIVDSLYERSAGKARQKRVDYASQLMDPKYAEKISAGGSRAAPTQGAPAAPGNTPATGGSTGDSGVAAPVKPSTGSSGMIDRSRAVSAPPPAPVLSTNPADYPEDYKKILNQEYVATGYQNPNLASSAGKPPTPEEVKQVETAAQQELIAQIQSGDVKPVYKPAGSASTPAQGTPAAVTLEAEKPGAIKPSADDYVAPDTDTGDAGEIPEVVTMDTSLPREEAAYALEKLDMLDDPSKPVPAQTAVVPPAAPAATPAAPVATTVAAESAAPQTAEIEKSVASVDAKSADETLPASKVNPVQKVAESLGLTPEQQQNAETSWMQNILGGNKYAKVASTVRAAQNLKNVFKPAQERTQGDVLSQESATLETNKMTSAIQPIVLNNMMSQGGGGCRFVPTPPAPLPAVDIKNADPSIRSAFSRDRWA